VRVLVAEDELLLREGLVRLLGEAGFEVVAQVGDAEDAVRRSLALKPDVVLLDIRMPPTHSDEGLRVAEHLHERLPGTAVLLLSHHVEAAYAVRLLERRSTGIGYLLKDRVTDLETFAEAVRRVGAGGTVVDPKVVKRLMDRPRVDDPVAGLTDRERDLLALMAEGRSNAAIARAMYLSPKTVETHVRSIFGKLGLAPDEGDNRRVLAVIRFLRAAQG
jgi:DNA-binding NarL/FixJ family response regulator